jgi:hypothetical protein
LDAGTEAEGCTELEGGGVVELEGGGVEDDGGGIGGGGSVESQVPLSESHT